jgi:aldehyde:ferredoxin oxidoreductase
LGDLFAEGLRRVVDALEGELPQELIRLGRELEFDFGFIAHREGRFRDREPLPFWVISAMMHAGESRDPTIGAHQSSLMHATLLWHDSERALRRFRALSQTVWGYADALEPTFEHKAPVAVWSQNQHVLIDSLPLCDFAFPQLVRWLDSRQAWLDTEDIVGDLDIDRRLFLAVTGREMTREELDRAAERGFTLERLMLARAGRGRRMEETLAPHFALPCQSDGTSVDAAEFSRLLDEYYAERGWDLAFGWPTDACLERLGLEDAIPKLEQLRRQFPDAAVGGAEHT